VLTVTVPGNLLLLGEYAVLEPGGLGLAVAVNHRVRVTAEPASRLSIEGRMGRAVVHWPEDDPHGFFAAVLKRVGEELHTTQAADVAKARIVADSSAFYRSDGSKQGYGSSAAVTVGIVAALLRLAGYAPERLRERLMPVAVQAHRATQGGRGSGYDVAISCAGGVGRFTGGELPSLERLFAPFLPRLGLIAGPASVSTTPAIRHYEVWKRRAPTEHRQFLRKQNELVRQATRATEWNEARPAVEAARLLGERLGESIDVPATVPRPGALGPTDTWKAVGAGDELAVVFAESALPAGVEPLAVAPDGVQWHEE
jgi:phosphomevalonate kinase